MIKIKKLLTSLASLSVAASAASLAVSCGLSNEDLLNRQIDTSVYKTVYSNSIQNWNMAATMQSGDFKILANTQDTLLTYDNNKELQPQILETVPEVKNDEATMTVSPNAKWFNMTSGKSIRNINANDIANTARYTLNKNFGSELSKDWQTFIRGAKDFGDGNLKEDEFIIKGNKNPSGDKWGIWVIDDKTVTFHLLKGTNYFTSALTTGTFAPTPKEALDMGFAYGRNNDYKNVLASGPYYVSKDESSVMEFKINPNYFGNKNRKGTIDTIQYFRSKNTDDISKRRYWETGDITEAKISRSDKYATKKFDNFEAVETQPNNLVGQKYLYFNFAKKNDDGTIDKESNGALSLPSVRKWISSGLDRTLFVQYFAGTKDEKEVSKYLSNTLTPLNFIDDYSKILKEKAELKDKLDPYLNRDNSLMQKAKDDLKGNKVTLEFLTSGDNAKTFNPYIRWMLDDFNQIPDNPIQIKEEVTGDDAAYQAKQRKSDFSMFITGQTPTYKDPTSFLVNFTANGTMAHYNGTESLFKDDNGKLSWDGNAQKDYGVDKSLLDDYQKFNSVVDDANPTYDELASAETAALFDYNLNLPMYIPDGQEINYLTYVDPERPNVGYGYNDYRLENIVLHKTAKELSEHLQKDDKNKQAIVKQD